MTVQTINVGARVNDETAETVYSAFTKTNSNFSDLDTRVSSAESTVATLSADMTELHGLFGTDVEAATFTTKQNDLAVAAGTRILRWNGAGTTGITGIAAPSTARVVTIVNASTDYLLWLENQNTASSAGNRFALPDGFPAFLMPGDTITVWYDLTSAVWRVLDWPTRGQGMGLTELDDALGKSSQRWYTRTGGTGATVDVAGSGVDSTHKSAGVFGLSTGTTTTGYAMAGGYATGVLPGLGSALFVSRSRVDANPSAAENFTAFLGLADFNSTYANGIFWEKYWNGSSYTLARTVMVGGVKTRSESGYQTASGTTKWLCVFVNPTWTRADFIHSSNSVSFDVADVISSGLPTAAVQFQTGIVKSAGSTSRNLEVDLRGHRYVQVRA